MHFCIFGLYIVFDEVQLEFNGLAIIGLFELASTITRFLGS